MPAYIREVTLGIGFWFNIAPASAGIKRSAGSDERQTVPLLLLVQKPSYCGVDTEVN